MEVISTYLQSQDIFSWQILSLLVFAGFLVGFINTIAGSGTVITYSVFMLLGLPANIANGTIRLGVIMQTLTATLNFKKNKLLDYRKGFRLAFTVVLGSVLGAQIAVGIQSRIFELILGVVMLILLFFIFFKPSKWLTGHQNLNQKQGGKWEQLIFFGIGLYGGFIHIGVGIFLLSSLVLKSGYDLVRANALKVMIVLVYSPFALFVYMYHGQIDYRLGLISSIGNILGAFVASKMAIKKGSGFVRWFLLAVMLLFIAKLLGILKF